MVTKPKGQKASSVTLDREEYKALTALRDETHDLLVVAHRKLQQRYAELGDVNQRQVALVNRVTTERQALAEKLEMMNHEHIRLSQLETPEKLLERNKALEGAVNAQHLEIKMLQRSQLAEVCDKLRADLKQSRNEVKALKKAIGAGKPA